MNVLQEIEEIIKEFNSKNNENLDIDSIRISFSKQYKKEKLNELGNWKKINKNDKRIMDKLNRRLDTDEITSAYQLEQYNIYYFNSNKDKKYRKAMMVIFGMKQYHKSPPPQHIVSKIISMILFKKILW